MSNSESDNVIELESPNGGEFISYGSTVEIKWRSQDVHVVNIYVEKLDRFEEPEKLPPAITKIAHFLPTTKFNGFIWNNVGAETGGPGLYVVCITNGTNEKVGDCSDNMFIVTKRKTD